MQEIGKHLRSRAWLAAATLCVPVAMIAPAQPLHAAAAPVVIQFWNPTNPGPGSVSGNAIKYLVDTFNKTHPGILVKADYTPTDNNYVKYTTALTSGSPPDAIMTYDYYPMPIWAADHLIQPLDSYIAQYHFTLQQYFPNVYAGMRFNGQIYGLPQQIDEPLFAWNKTLFKAAGLDPNKPPTTTAELMADAVKLTKVQNGQITQLGIAPADSQSDPEWIYYFGGGLYKPSTRSLTANLPANIQAYTWLKQLYDKLGGFEKVNAWYQTASKANDPFLLGTQAMELMGEYQPSYIPLQAPKLQYGVAPVPTGPGVPYGSVTVAPAGNFFVLPKGASHPKEALEFLTWMASPFAVNYWCTVEGNLPPSASDAFGAAFWNAAPKLRPWITELKQARTIAAVPAISTFNFLYNTLTTINQEILSGNVSPTQGLNQLQTQVTQNEQQFTATHPGWQ